MIPKNITEYGDTVIVNLSLKERNKAYARCEFNSNYHLQLVYYQQVFDELMGRVCELLFDCHDQDVNNFIHEDDWVKQLHKYASELTTKMISIMRS